MMAVCFIFAVLFALGGNWLMASIFFVVGLVFGWVTVAADTRHARGGRPPRPLPPPLDQGEPMPDKGEPMP